MKNSREYQICTRCVMDTFVPDIRFDANGQCHFCEMHDEMEKRYPSQPELMQKNLEKLVEKVKAAGQGKPYDCVCGTSGGRDSTWTLYKAKQLGLRPLAVHFDNGWNSEIAVSNIQNATRILDIDLETVVADWNEFRDLQDSFLKASVPDVEIPTDVAIHSVLHLVAAKEGIKYIFNGHSFRTEGIAPKSWTYMDGRYIESVHRMFGKKELKDFKNFTLKDFFYYTFINRIHVVPILNYTVYEHAHVQEVLERELEWKYYGGHHYESYYTKLVQSYYLPVKFHVDKRKTELSALIRSGQTTRPEALKVLEEKPFEPDEELLNYTPNKLSLTRADWDAIMAAPVKSFHDYPTYYPIMRLFKYPIRIACELNILPKLLYLKFLG